MNRLIVIVGITLVAIGLLWPYVRKLPLFHLPGDIVIDRPGLKLFVPITTMLVLSLVISLVMWIMRR